MMKCSPNMATIRLGPSGCPHLFGIVVIKIGQKQLVKIDEDWENILPHYNSFEEGMKENFGEEEESDEEEEVVPRSHLCLGTAVRMAAGRLQCDAMMHYRPGGRKSETSTNITLPRVRMVGRASVVKRWEGSNRWKPRPG